MPSTSLAGAMPLSQAGGRHRRGHGASVKTLKRMLKKAGLKTTGRKAALTRRAKKAHLKLRGGVEPGLSNETPASSSPSSSTLPSRSNADLPPSPPEERTDRSFAPEDYYDGESGKGVRPSEAKKKEGGRSRRSRRGIFGKLKLY